MGSLKAIALTLITEDGEIYHYKNVVLNHFGENMVVIFDPEEKSYKIYPVNKIRSITINN